MIQPASLPLLIYGWIIPPLILTARVGITPIVAGIRPVATRTGLIEPSRQDSQADSLHFLLAPRLIMSDATIRMLGIEQAAVGRDTSIDEAEPAADNPRIRVVSRPGDRQEGTTDVTF